MKQQVAFQNLKGPRVDLPLAGTCLGIDTIRLSFSHFASIS